MVVVGCNRAILRSTYFPDSSATARKIVLNWRQHCLTGKRTCSASSVLATQTPDFWWSWRPTHHKCRALHGPRCGRGFKPRYSDIAFYKSWPAFWSSLIRQPVRACVHVRQMTSARASRRWSVATATRRVGAACRRCCPAVAACRRSRATGPPVSPPSARSIPRPPPPPPRRRSSSR